MKRFERRQVGFLSREHIEAIIAATDVATWTGRRDRVLLATLYNTGARVSEIIRVQLEYLTQSGNPAVRLHGKGRKERSVSLWSTTASQLRRWLREQPPGGSSPLFPNPRGSKLSRTNVTERLQLAALRPGAVHKELAQTQGDTAYLPPFSGDAPASGRRRYLGYRSLARSREPIDDPHVC